MFRARFNGGVTWSWVTDRFGPISENPKWATYQISLGTFQPPSKFPSEISRGLTYPKFPQGKGDCLAHFGPEGPEIGAEGTFLEIFCKFSIIVA